MAKEITEQQIVQYILSGGDVQDLLKSKNVGWKRLLQAIVKNPQLISSTEQYAAEATAGLDKYDPTRNYVPEGEPQFNMNPIDLKYKSMNPKIASFSDKYFGVLKETGNNPTLVDSHNQQMKDIAMKEYGMSDQEAQGIVTALDADRDAWMKEQIQLDIAGEKANYEAFQQQRKALDLAEGQTPQQKMSEKFLGFEELVNIPSPKSTFEEYAKKAAARAVPESTPRQKKLESMPAPTVDRFIGSKQDKILKQESDAKKRLDAGKRSLVEASYKAMAQKLAGKGGTPYTQAIKKLLPVIAAKKGKL